MMQTESVKIDHFKFSELLKASRLKQLERLPRFADTNSYLQIVINYLG